MAKVKLTKNELKKQRDQLKRFQRYLPTLILKKQQLQMVLRQIEAAIAEQKAKRDRYKDDIGGWVGVFAEDIDVTTLVALKSVDTEVGNIAGIDIPVYKAAHFEEKRWDLFRLPLWVDQAIVSMKELIALDIEVEVLQKQHDLVSDELRVTTQRVNLFEKVKIPETKENIRNIRIYLGDQQTAAVVRGKIAKSNLVEV
ncbi:MAG: V-type ATP synthase subunit D [Spirochaetota bacterium]